MEPFEGGDFGLIPSVDEGGDPSLDAMTHPAAQDRLLLRLNHSERDTAPHAVRGEPGGRHAAPPSSVATNKRVTRSCRRCCSSVLSAASSTVAISASYV